jgi:hypothetical protein
VIYYVDCSRVGARDWRSRPSAGFECVWARARTVNPASISPDFRQARFLWDNMLPWHRVLTSSKSIFQMACEHVLVALTVCAGRAR